MDADVRGEEDSQKNETGAGAGSLSAATELVRESAQYDRTAGVFLLVVLVGVVGRLAAGGAAVPWAARGHGTALLGLSLLAAMAGAGAISATQLVRSRITFVRALGEMRRGTGAPLDPFTPWAPYGSRLPLSPAVLERELRRLLSTADRCCALAWQAEAWAAAAGLLFAFWMLASVGAR
jgi:hypothetical protein